MNGRTALPLDDWAKPNEGIRSVACRLIEAHDEELRGIAKELHGHADWAMVLRASLGQLEQAIELDYRVRARIHNILDDLGNLGVHIQALSGRLGSSKLEFLGLEMAARTFCREFSNKKHVEVRFTSVDVPTNLSCPVSRALFRVLQEALDNVAKHSGVSCSEVFLKGNPGEVELTVRDSGTGFDLESAIKGSGLGLISMCERLKSVQGTMSIFTKPLAGTEVQARVFLISKRYVTGAG